MNGRTETPIPENRLTNALGAAIERPVKEAVHEALAEGIDAGEVTLVTLDAEPEAEEGATTEPADEAAETPTTESSRRVPRRLLAGGAAVPLLAAVAYHRYRRSDGDGEPAAEGASTRSAVVGSTDPGEADIGPVNRTAPGVE